MVVKSNKARDAAWHEQQARKCRDDAKRTRGIYRKMYLKLAAIHDTEAERARGKQQQNAASASPA